MDNDDDLMILNVSERPLTTIQLQLRLFNDLETLDSGVPAGKISFREFIKLQFPGKYEDHLIHIVWKKLKDWTKKGEKKPLVSTICVSSDDEDMGNKKVEGSSNGFNCSVVSNGLLYKADPVLLSCKKDLKETVVLSSDEEHEQIKRITVKSDFKIKPNGCFTECLENPTDFLPNIKYEITNQQNGMNKKISALRPKSKEQAMKQSNKKTCVKNKINPKQTSTSAAVNRKKESITNAVNRKKESTTNAVNKKKESTTKAAVKKKKKSTTNAVNKKKESTTNAVNKKKQSSGKGTNITPAEVAALRHDLLLDKLIEVALPSIVRKEKKRLSKTNILKS